MKLNQLLAFALLVCAASITLQADILDDIAQYVKDNNVTPQTWNKNAIKAIVENQIQADDEALSMIGGGLMAGFGLAGWLVGAGLSGGEKTNQGTFNALFLYSMFGPEGETKDTVNDLIKILIIIDLVVLAIRLFPAAVVFAGTLFATPFAALLAMKIGVEKLYHKALLTALSTSVKEDDKKSLIKAFNRIAEINQELQKSKTLENYANRFAWKNYIRGVLAIRDVPADEEGAQPVVPTSGESKIKVEMAAQEPVAVIQQNLWGSVPVQPQGYPQMPQAPGGPQTQIPQYGQPPVIVHPYPQQTQYPQQQPPYGQTYTQAPGTQPQYQPQYQLPSLHGTPSPYRVIGQQA